MFSRGWDKLDKTEKQKNNIKKIESPLFTLGLDPEGPIWPYREEERGYLVGDSGGDLPLYRRLAGWSRGEGM